MALNLLASKAITITGDGGEMYRFTLTRFSSEGEQRLRLYELLARHYIIEDFAIEGEALDDLSERIFTKQEYSAQEFEVFTVQAVARAWARIFAALTEVEEWNGEEWLAMGIPDEIKTIDTFRRTFPDKWINELNVAVMDLNPHYFPRSPSDEEKKIVNASTQPSAKSSTNSPKPSRRATRRSSSRTSKLPTMTS